MGNTLNTTKRILNYCGIAAGIIIGGFLLWYYLFVKGGPTVWYLGFLVVAAIVIFGTALFNIVRNALRRKEK